MDGLRLVTDVERVDWTALRQALVDDDFHNGRTPEEYERSAWGSFLNVVAYRSDLRRRGVGRAMVLRLLEACEGQHVELFTDDMEPFYETLGFAPQPTGMSRVVGSWLRLP